MRNKSSKSDEPEFEFKSPVNWLWTFMVILVIIGTIANAIAMFYPKWREVGPIAYSYKYRNSRLNHQVGKVMYGLYKLDYDSSSVVQTWDIRVQLSKVKATAAAQVGQDPIPGQTLNIWASMCPPSCQEAVIFRARVYDDMRADNIIALAALAISSAFALGGVLWYMIVGKNFLVILGCWITASIIQIGALAYWIYQTDYSWTQISSKQQVPYPSLSICCYIALSVVGVYLIASLGIYLAFYIELRSWNSQSTPSVNSTSWKGMMPPMNPNIPMSKPGYMNQQSPYSGFNPTPNFPNQNFPNPNFLNQNFPNQMNFWGYPQNANMGNQAGNNPYSYQMPRRNI